MAGLPGAAPAANATAQASVSAPQATATDGFDFTLASVRAAAQSLLDTLPEASPVKGTGPVYGFAIQSDRDGKTVNSIMVKTNKCGGFPRPAGSIVVVIHFDNQADLSFTNFLHEQGIELADGEMPYFLGLNAPVGDHVGLVDEEDPACHAYLKAVYFEVLAGLSRRGDVGFLVSDGFGDFATESANECALFEAGVGAFSELKPGDWMPRKKLWRQAMNLNRRAVVPGGAFVVNGPEHKGDGEDKTVILPNGKRITQKVKSKWLDCREIEKDLNVVLHIDVGEDEVGETTWVGEVLIGRHPLFKRGAKCDDLRGKNAWAIAEQAEAGA